MSVCFDCYNMYIMSYDLISIRWKDKYNDFRCTIKNYIHIYLNYRLNYAIKNLLFIDNMR